MTSTAPRKRSKSKKARRRIVAGSIGLGVLILFVVAAGVWIGIRASAIKENLEASSSLLPQLKSALLANDKNKADAALSSLRQHTAAARDAGTDPLWKAASGLPWLGANLSAGTEVSVAADDIVNLAAQPLVQVFDSLDWKDLTPSKGAVQVAPLKAAAPNVVSAARTVQLSYDRLDDIDTRSLLPQIAQPLDQAKAQLDEARKSLNTAAGAAQLIPAMMGADGPRNYLLLIQNSAEIRASGGVSGALAVLGADNGSIKLVAQGTANGLGRFVPPLNVDPNQEAIFTNRLGTFIQDANITPDFPTTARTAKAMWEKRNPGQSVDGVIAIDAVVLADVLKVTGPIELPTEAKAKLTADGLPSKLSSDNAVKTLLSDVYAKIPEPSNQDPYFAAVAKSVFEAVSNGRGSGENLIKALSSGVSEDRILVWSSHPDEQKVIESQPISGAISGPSVPAAGFGVYFNDGTGAKMDYYVKRTVQLIRGCEADGYLGYRVKVTLTSYAPADAATSLPMYVTAGGAFGVPPGHVQTNVVVYGPAQARVRDAKLDGAASPFGSFRQAERPIGIVTVNLAPGETKTVEINFDKVVQTSPVEVAVTPTIQRTSDVLKPLEIDGCKS